MKVDPQYMGIMAMYKYPEKENDDRKPIVILTGSQPDLHTYHSRILSAINYSGMQIVTAKSLYDIPNLVFINKDILAKKLINEKNLTKEKIIEIINENLIDIKEPEKID